jgi:tetratricopeptide (TPR) repeat protein
VTEAGGGVDEPAADFNARALNFLRRVRDENPPSDETVALGAEVVALAEEQGASSQVIAFRYFHLQALLGAGRMDEAMVAFPKLLSYGDRHPNDDNAHYALTAYKWMVYNARQFPQVTKAQVESMLQDFETRVRREGLSLRPAHHARMDWAVALERREEAAAHFRKWQAAPRDQLSDCPVCELHNRVEYLVFLGKDEEAVGSAKHLLTGRRECTSVPDKTFGILLSPLLRLGRREEALDLHQQGYRRVAGKRRYVDAAAEHLTFLVRAGELGEAVRVFESFLPLALEIKSPSKRFSFMLAGWLLLDRLRASEHDAAALRLPAAFDGRRFEGGYDLEALIRQFSDETKKLARSFDDRDGTKTHAGRIKATIDADAHAAARARVRPAEAPSAREENDKKL